MDTSSRAESADNLYHDSDDPDTSSNVKVKTKRPGVLGKLKNRIFGSKKRRTRSHGSTKGGGEGTPDTSSLSSHKAKSTNELSEGNDERLNNTIFSPAEDLNMPKTGMIGMKNSSASLEALTSSSKLKSELERKLVNRRSLEDDGLPGSPIGTPTADIMSHSAFMKNSIRKSQDSHRDRDSDGSLLSIGSSENEEDAFFKNPWKGAYTSAIRRPRHGTLSSDSEPEDALDFDAVAKTENLSNAAAMHKRNVRPRHRNKARRVTAATGQMPSLAEKKTLEIAHTFLDEGETTPAVKLRNLDTAAPSIAVRRADSGCRRNSPSVQRKSESNIVNELPTSKSPKPVTRSATSAAVVSHRRQQSDEQQAVEDELLSVFQRRKPPAALNQEHASESQTIEQKSTPPIVTASEPAVGAGGDKTEVPPRPAKSVGFTGTPPLQRRVKPPAVQPRPKSMFPQHARSKTQEVQGSNVDEALSNLSYSKSFHVTESNKSNDDGIRLKLPGEIEKTQSLPEWARLAKRKTWAHADSDDHSNNLSESNAGGSEVPPPKPARVPKAKPIDTDNSSQADVARELQTKLLHASVRAEQSTPTSLPGANTDTRSATSPQDTVPCDNDSRQALYGSKFQPIKSDRGPTVTGKKSPYDNVTFSFNTKSSSNEGTESKDSSMNSKAKASTLTSISSESSSEMLPTAEPPWKLSLKQRQGSLKSTPTSSAESGGAAPTPATRPKPAWRSATMKERPAAQPSFLSSSMEGLDDLQSAKGSTRSMELSDAKVDRMTMSETSAYSTETTQQDLTEGEEPKSFRDRLKMFQSQ